MSSAHARFREKGVPDVLRLVSGGIQMQDALLAMFVLNRGRLVGHLYLGSTLADARESVGQTTLPTMWDTGETS